MNEMFKKSIIAICFSIFILAGCMQGAMTLKRLQNSQQELDEEVKTQEKFFFALSDDVKNNRLQKGISKKEILAKYGEGIFAKPINDVTEKKEVLAYRHPTEFFSSDLIYLYFDKEERLVYWEIKPAFIKAETKQ